MLCRLVTAVPLPDKVVEDVGDVFVPEVVEAFIRLSRESTPACTAEEAATDGVLSPPAVPFSEDLPHW